MKRKTENGKRRTENGKRRILRSTLSVFRFPFSVIFLLLLVCSCSSRKKLVSSMTHVADYQWMTAKMTGELTLQDSLSTYHFTGSLRMRRDSIVWMSASVMGMEAMRALINCDSVFVINRLEKTYLAEPVVTMTETMHVPSLQETQAMLLGNGTSDHVEIQWGSCIAKIHYSDIQWDIPTTFPIKINQSYERMKL